jgi:hypothetical protein
MNSSEIRQQIEDYLDLLSPDRLLVASDFLAYLAERQEQESKESLSTLTQFQARLEQAQKDVSSGKVISVEQLKRKY